MLYLNPPYHVIEGHTLLPDHADPSLYYAIPPAPRLSLKSDGVPEFSLLQFLGGTAPQRLEGALLTLGLELSVAADALPRLAAKLEAKQSGLQQVRVVPALFDDGVVELVALGAASAVTTGGGATDTGGGPSAARPTQGPFSVQFLGSGRPSLDATNRVTFQLMLDAAAAELLEQALDTPDVPIIAVYRMGLVGLRPSFEIDVKADWHKLYRSLQNKLKVNAYYVSADVDVKLDEALEESGIRIDSKVFGAGAGAQAAAERARKQLVDWVFNRLFEPLLDPAAATANAVGRVIDDTISSLARAVLPGVSYKLRLVDENQLRTLSARMAESVAERREVVPQGTLGGVLQRFRVQRDGSPDPAWAEARAKLVQKVNLDGFPRIEVAVAVEDRFASDGVSLVEVELSRVNAAGARTHSHAFAFRSAAEREAFAVNLLGEADPRLQAPYEYRYTVHFDPASPFGAHPPVSGAWQSGRTAELFVEPRSAQTYSVRRVQLALTPTFSFSQFGAVTVELRSGEGTAVQSIRLVLAEQRRQEQWSYRSFGPGVAPYRYRVTYHRPADRGGDIQTQWAEATEEWLSIPDPLPRKRSLSIVASLPWAELLAAFVQLRYADPVHDVHYDEHIDLAQHSPLLRRDIPIAEGGPLGLSYRLTLLMQDGGLMEGSWRETEDDRIVLDRRSVAQRVLRVRAIGGTLRDNRLAEVRVRLQAREPERDAVREEALLRIRAEESEQKFPAWEYMLGDPPLRAVHYDALFIDEQGFTDAIAWRRTESDLVVIDLRKRTATA